MADDLFNGLGTYTETSTDYLRAVYDYNVRARRVEQGSQPGADHRAVLTSGRANVTLRAALPNWRSV